jgi:hypothetical protein
LSICLVNNPFNIWIDPLRIPAGFPAPAPTCSIAKLLLDFFMQHGYAEVMADLSRKWRS